MRIQLNRDDLYKILEEKFGSDVTFTIWLSERINEYEKRKDIPIGTLKEVPDDMYNIVFDLRK